MRNGGHIREEELELLALGGLPDDEAAAVQAHVAACGECAKKLAESRGSAALLGFTAKQERPAGTVKAELMARVRSSSEREEHYAWPMWRQNKGDGETAEYVTSRRKNGWLNWVLAPAAAALALVSLALSWQNRRVSEALEKQRLATETLLHDRERTSKLVAVLAAGDTVTVKLAPTGETVGSGVVKYNGRMGMVAYSVQLPVASAGKSYQMWLIPVKGVPISAGMMEKGAPSLGPVWMAEVPANTETKGFAITLEPAGGMPQPTGPKVLAGAS